MEPPTEQVFDSRELLIASVREHALSQGYAVTTIRSEVGIRGLIYRKPYSEVVDSGE